ncbi:sulfotransferase domain-containing protein [Azospirillum sp.]|uniref:sulfotransferase domain-containing protein n=1 Tax=Azospirillum sp. TaxID=34012 RepID=UPI002D3EF113|nr:sulfotransferase domain-containing protein [Azospirillum sp.]HYD69829.1 sulfotransferase domain-containing protein [Azospirillum sp.]
MAGFYWLVSYPKSGNTWLRLAMHCLQNGGDAVDFAVASRFAPVAADRRAFDALLDVESSDLTPTEVASLRPRLLEAQARATPEPLFRKVHDAWTLTPLGEPLFPPAVTLGALYIVRDPRDVAVSYAHFYDLSLDAAIAKMADHGNELAKGWTRLGIQLPQKLLSWSGHVESWLDAPGPVPLLLRYEDMLADTEGALARVAAYVGWAADPGLLARTAAATRFGVLRGQEDRHGFRENFNASRPFFRRGEAGGWRDTLSAEQARRVEREHGRVMALLGYL